MGSVVAVAGASADGPEAPAVVAVVGGAAVLRAPVASGVAVVTFRMAASYHGGRSTVVEPTSMYRARQTTVTFAPSTAPS